MMDKPFHENWITPEWAPHANVRVRVTTRHGDYSPAPWRGFNLGANCDDDPRRVQQARHLVHEILGTACAPAWLRQVHGTRIIEAGDEDTDADGVFTLAPQTPCAVLTADCLPVLMARTDGSVVGAFHAGWRGLLDGILEAGVATLAPNGENVSAWLGPAICRKCYQVDAAVRDPFVQRDPRAAAGFTEDGDGRWRMDLFFLAQQRLAAAGVQAVEGGALCTHCNQDAFYSYRHEGQTGRFASLIWLTN